MAVSASKSIFVFERPPVEEVLCGIQFKSQDALVTAHCGQLWNRYKLDGYCGATDEPILVPSSESFGMESPSDSQPLPLPPRVWFHKGDRTAIVQVQRDRFLHNWKKSSTQTKYPKYHHIKSLFKERLDTFQSFLDENEIGRIQPTQYEITYVNHIAQGEGWETIEDIGEILPSFQWGSSSNKFLPIPSNMMIQSRFDLPTALARLHAVARVAYRKSDHKLMLLLELTVQGMPNDPSGHEMWDWFDTAREWIVWGFADLTHDEIQTKIWGRS